MRPDDRVSPSGSGPADAELPESVLRRWLLALVGAYLLVSLPLLLQAPIANRAEMRCSEVVQGMLSSGDWLVPRLEGTVRLNKPPLAYWTGAAASWALGEASLAALRLPSLLAAAGLLLVTYAWGRRVGGPRLGLAAAACLAAMELTIAYGHRGVAEMQLALYCNLALLCFDRVLEEPGLAWRAGFGLCLGLALLAKATAGLMLVGVPVAVILTARRRWRDALAPRNLVWVAVALGLGLAWYVAIVSRVPGSLQRLEADLLLPVGAEEAELAPGAAHYNPPWFHVGSLLKGAVPAFLLLPWAVRRAASTRLWRGMPRHRFVLVVFASLFVAFSLLPQKQKHYMLPLLPSLAILLADGALARSRLDPVSFARNVRRLAWGAAAFVLVATAFAAGWEVRTYSDVPAAVTLAAGGVLIVAALAVVAARGRPSQVAGVGVVATLVLMLLYGSFIEPHQPPPRSAPAATSAPSPHISR